MRNAWGFSYRVEQPSREREHAPAGLAKDSFIPGVQVTKKVILASEQHQSIPECCAMVSETEHACPEKTRGGKAPTHLQLTHTGVPE